MGQFSGTDGIGIIWFLDDNYTDALEFMIDGNVLPKTFDQWLERANQAVSFVVREGGNPIRVEFDIEKFIAFCALHDLNFDAEGRRMFAADPANWPLTSKH